MKLTRLYFWSDTHSIASIIAALYANGEFFLASVVLVFSALLPGFKLFYITLAGVLTSRDPVRRARWFRRIEWLGKWSMLDVLVLALLVFYAQAAQFANATALPGIYFFAASVILTMIAYNLIGRQAEFRRRKSRASQRMASLHDRYRLKSTGTNFGAALLHQNPRGGVAEAIL